MEEHRMKRFILSLSVPLLPLLFCARMFGQNTWNVIAGHPRLMINDTVADTWSPGMTRLAAVAQRVMNGGNTAAQADFATLLAGIPTGVVPLFADSSNEDANLNRLLDYALAYALYHKAGNDTAANPYAATAWAGMQLLGGTIYPILTITSDGTGLATVTFASAPNPPMKTGTAVAIWGPIDDSWCGGQNILSAPTPTTATYQTLAHNTSISTSGVFATTFWGGLDQHATGARALAQWSYFYDWCYDWLVANGHDAYARSQIIAGYWASTPTRLSSAFGDNIRESDFHNYASWPGSAIIEAGVALFGDDPLGAKILDDGAGYLWKGIQVQPADCCSDTYEYNLKKSNDTLTGGAMNWEGPTYWRAGTIRFLRALEAFDAATGRQNDIWHTQFPNTKSAGMYKIYLLDPAGNMANFGDEGNSVRLTGRDNFGLAIINDRFPDPHLVWLIDTIGDWNSGDNGQTGLVYKLIYYPYVSGPGSHDPTDLPLAAQFGPDVMIRDGWASSSTFITYTGSLRGVYHRHEDAGSFTVYRNAPLVLGQPYTLGEPAYSNYNRRTIGGNTLTIYDPSDCWKDNAPTCGVDGSGTNIVNDGGQLRTLRRLQNEFATSGFQISRAWSGSVYSDPLHSAVYGQFDGLTLPVLAVGSGYEHVTQDLTNTYVNSFSGTGDNPHAKVAATNGVSREFIHFQATNGSLNPLVIFDRVTALDPAFTKSWLLHTVNPPTVDGKVSGPGDTTYSGGSVTSADNGTGRLYVNHLLPRAPDAPREANPAGPPVRPAPSPRKVRTVGGNACAAIPILGATTARDALFYAPGHGLKVGESIGFDTGTGADGGPWAPGWQIDNNNGPYSVASVPDPDHFTAGVDSTGWPSWASSFASGTGAPGGPGGFKGQAYYQTDAPAGNTVWQWDPVQLWKQIYPFCAGAGAPFCQNYPSGWGYTSPIVYTHANCNYSYHVDQFGPPGSGPGFLWNASMDWGAPNTRPNWLVQVTASDSKLTDYFLNVVTATTTSVNNPPSTSLISGHGVYGVQISDSKGAYVAVFPTDGPVASIDYTTLHAGVALHVISDLKPGQYAVTQNGKAISGDYRTDRSGAIAFREKGGGSFQAALANKSLAGDACPLADAQAKPSGVWKSSSAESGAPPRCGTRAGSPAAGFSTNGPGEFSNPPAAPGPGRPGQ
jgi:hypothetical protein